MIDSGNSKEQIDFDDLIISSQPIAVEKVELPGGSEGESIAKGTFVIFLARLFGLAGTFVTMNIVLPRLMPEGNFGTFQVLMSFVLAFEVALHYGLPAAVAKFISEDHAFVGYFLQKGFKLQMAFSMIVFAISLVVCPVATLYFKETFIFALLFAFAMVDIPVYAMYNIRMSVLNGLRRFSKESITVMWYQGSRAVMTIGGVLWAYKFGRIDLMIPIALGANLISSFVGWIWSDFYLRGVSGYREDQGMLKSVIGFALPNIIAMFCYQALLKVDLWCVSGFITSEIRNSRSELADGILGSYALSGLIALIPSLLYHSLYPALFPTISHHLAQKNLRRIRSIITQATKAGFIVLLPVSVAMCGSSKEIFLILVGQRYDYAWIYLGVLVFSMCAYTFYLSASIIIIASNHPQYCLKNVAGLLVLAFILNWIFMKLLPFNVFGPDEPIGRALAGPAVAIVVGLIGTYFFGMWIYRRYGVFTRIVDIVKISLAVLVPAPILWLIDLPTVQWSYVTANYSESLSPLAYRILSWIGFGVIAEYLIYFFCYSILLFLFGAFDPTEKEKILKLLRLRKKSVPEN